MQELNHLQEKRPEIGGPDSRGHTHSRNFVSIGRTPAWNGHHECEIGNLNNKDRVFDRDFNILPDSTQEYGNQAERRC
ncbi:MAG: hypothetical protein HN757_02555 [Calditrichaeota bacterium]|jgi:hypothetical protein|nr:hypothetical protein [Calditrichota bacterium]